VETICDFIADISEKHPRNFLGLVGAIVLLLSAVVINAVEFGSSAYASPRHVLVGDIAHTTIP